MCDVADMLKDCVCDVAYMWSVCDVAYMLIVGREALFMSADADHCTTILSDIYDVAYMLTHTHSPSTYL